MTNIEKLEDGGFNMDEIVVFTNPSFEGALVGVSQDDRAIYDYELMVESLIEHDEMTEEEAIEWIEYNTIRSLPYVENAPIIMTGLID